MQITVKVTGLLLLGALLHNSASAEHSNSDMLTNTCVACHGDSGSSAGPAIPNLASTSRNYMMGAMLAYKYDDNPEKLEEVIDSDPDFENVEAFPRFSTIMGRLAKGYTEEEIKLIDEHFSSLSPARAKQSFDSEKATAGKKLHKKYCEKCHENEGRSAEDDTGILAGQWKPYFLYSMQDFSEGSRMMPKKMRNKLEEITESEGQAGIEQLAEYYSSIQE